ncbi:MAG: nucleotidyltransferase family protein [Firmicutes bacterium]|nr:nucleotidyltransferase family protein [Bacillota bacterium]
MEVEEGLGPLAAIIPAAGESRRMVTLKQLLPWAGGKTVLETVIVKLARPPVRQVIVVLGHQGELIRERLEKGVLRELAYASPGRPWSPPNSTGTAPGERGDFPGGGATNLGTVPGSSEGPEIQLVFNHNYHRGMLSSIKVGLSLLTDSSKGFFLCPGDHPAFDPAVVRQLAEMSVRSQKGIVIPTHQGRRGHPALFSRKFLGEILTLPDELGLRELNRRHPEEILEVPVEDGGILADLDYREDYHRFRPSDYRERGKENVGDLPGGSPSPAGRHRRSPGHSGGNGGVHSGKNGFQNGGLP